MRGSRKELRNRLKRLREQQKLLGGYTEILIVNSDDNDQLFVNSSPTKLFSSEEKLRDYYTKQMPTKDIIFIIDLW